MLFVNEIAQIVHGIVDRFQGAANKNIGDAFLLVWKFDDIDIIYEEGEIMVNNLSPAVHKIADLAFISFLKINVKINRNPICLKYRKHPKLIERMKNYAVKMGYGLHIGWAIEGAIGSEFKIDASYLSPNVNMASRLEAATKQFGVPLLISGELYELLSPEIQEKCRHIDTVKVKGSNVPMDLYTSDMDMNLLTPSNDYLEKKAVNRRKRKIIRKQVLDSNYETSWMFDASNELRSVRFS